MKKIICISLILSYAICNAQNNKENKDINQQFASLGNFKLENGSVIEDCRIGYRTYGKLNSTRNNCILYTTWFGGTTHDLEQFVPGKWIDTTRYYLVMVDALGDGVSSTPSNSKTQAGPGFPQFSILDMVETQHELLTKVFHLQHLFAVVGLSMGGMQAFQWAVSYPDFADHVIPIVGSPRLTSYDLALWNLEMDIIHSDTAFHNGKYKRLFAIPAVSLISFMSLTTPGHQVKTVSRDSFYVWKSSLPEQKGINWNNYCYQMQAMMKQDVSAKFGGSLENAAKAVKAKMLIIVSESDHTVNPEPAIEFAKRVNAQLIIRKNDMGHFGPELESEEVKKAFAEIFSDQ